MSSDDLHMLRVYTDISAVRGREPYWKVLIERAKAMNLGNASVLQVLHGFGPAATMHGAKVVDLAPGRDVIVEIVGMHPMLRQVPPSSSHSSKTATFMPSWLARMAAG
jgi:PII-like signaling protein